MSMQRRLHGAARARRGGALAVGLLAVMLMAMLGTSMMSLSSSYAKRQRGALDAKRAFYLAEAGLSEGSAAIALGQSGSVASEDAPARFGDGIFWVVATMQSDEKVRLASTAICGGGRCALELVVDPADDPVGALGLFGHQALTVGGASLVDSYDSTVGAYVAPSFVSGLLGLVTVTLGLSSQGTTARLGSNGSIGVAGSYRGTSTRVLGNVTPGPNGTVTVGSGAQISGSTAPAVGPQDLPPVQVPVVASSGNLAMATGASKTLTGTVGYGNITVGTGGKLTIKGPATVVLDKLTLGSAAQLNFDTSAGKVALYVQHTLSVPSNGLVTAVGTDPSRCSLYLTGDDAVPVGGSAPIANLQGSGKFYGQIYAPKMPLTVPTSLEVFGSLAGEAVILSPQAKFHYDVALAETGGAGDIPTALSWTIEDLPRSMTTGEVVEAQRVTTETQASLVRPSDAHVPNEWMAIYYDTAGVLRAYLGDPAKFDDSKVHTLVTQRAAVGESYQKLRGYLRQTISVRGLLTRIVL